MAQSLMVERVGVFRIQLEQTRRENIGFFVGIHDVQSFLELRERLVGLPHLCFQFVELLFHEG